MAPLMHGARVLLPLKPPSETADLSTKHPRPLVWYSTAAVVLTAVAVTAWAANSSKLTTLALVTYDNQPLPATQETPTADLNRTEEAPTGLPSSPQADLNGTREAQTGLPSSTKADLNKREEPRESNNGCRRTIPKRHYDGTCARKPTSGDLISNIDFKLAADYHLGPLPQPAGLRTPCKLSAEELPKLWDGVVIFVDAPAREKFVNKFLPNITVKFVLVSGDSPGGNPGRMDPAAVQALLSSPLLLHWYGMHCNQNPDPQKFTCIPIGVSQWNSQREGIARALLAGLGITCDLRQNLSNPKASGKGTVIVSFRVRNRKERPVVWDAMCGDKSRVKQLSHCYYNRSLDRAEHYSRISRSRFLVSPHGVGLDCYRTWEALYLGSYPIVKKSSLDEMYKGLPVLVLDSWEDVTPEVLEDTYNRFRQMSFDYQKLFKWYWFKRFRSHLAKNS